MSVAEAQGEKGDSSPKIALLNALREALSDTGRKQGRGAGTGDSPLSVLVTSIDSH